MLGHSSGQSDELSQRGPERDLVDAGLRDRAGDRHECRAGLVGRPDLTEPIGSKTGDQRKLSQGLDVLYERRRLADPPLERQRRGEGRLGDAPVEELDERRLLSCNESVRDRDRSQANPLVQPGPALRNCGREGIEPFAVGSRDGHDRFARAEGLRGGGCSVQDQVREIPQEDLVLAADRLPLGAVRDHDGTSPPSRDRTKLRRRREPGPAPAQEAARLDKHRQVNGARGWEQAVDREVLVQRCGSIGRGDAGQQTWQAGRPGYLRCAHGPNGCHSEAEPFPWTEPVKVFAAASRFKTIVSRSCAPDAFVRSAVTLLPCSATTLPE